MQSHYLGMQRPGLESAADFLLAHYTHGGQADMRGVTVVVPGGRAGRRLLEILVDRSAELARPLVPPEITTAHHLPERLYLARRPFANELTQQLAWVAALKQLAPDQLARIVAQRPPTADHLAWLELGRLLRSLHRELASDGLSFDDVLAHAQTLQAALESERWEIMAKIQRIYLDRLDALGLWDRQTARLVAVERRECRTDQPIVLLGLVDLNQTLRTMLAQVAEHVTVLVQAPSAWAERFDGYGCLVSDSWQTTPLAIPDASLLDADGPEDQCQQVTDWLRGLQQRFRAEEITIGLVDERLLPHLMRQLEGCGVPGRFGPGEPTERIGAVRLLLSLAAYAEVPSYVDFAALLRHPDVERWLAHQRVPPGWVDRLDDYYQDHLPVQMSGAWLHSASRRPPADRSVPKVPDTAPADPDGDSDPVRAEERTSESADVEPLTAAFEHLSALVGPLQGKARPLSAWLERISGVLLEIYGWRTFDLQQDADRRTDAACRQLLDAAGDLLQVPQSLQPRVTSQEAIQLLLDQLSGARIAEPARGAAVELVGWLELPLDDAPALMVMNFNEGLVPTSVNADLFLPGSFRARLGLDDNARRYARDAYAVATLLAPWRETKWMVARRDVRHDPQTPSRLLFADGEETVARRALRFFSDPRPSAEAGGDRILDSESSRPHAAFQRPRPAPLPKPITRLPVTAFKAYLACPYRFYLRYVLRLAALDDQAVEMDGGSFGTLAHLVLEKFGKGELRDATDAGAIEKCLSRLLDAEARYRYGQHPHPAVRVQIEQLRLRLRRFAAWQAARANEGWRIEFTECVFQDQAGLLDVDGQPFELTGRIDRIDVNLRTGERWLLDYKTSDSGKSPDKSHRKSKQWVDLQLPLYRHLIRARKIPEPIQLGYIVLPKDISKVGLSAAGWTEDDLQAADEVARGVVRGVRKQRFEPTTSSPPDFSEDLAGICRDGVFAGTS